MATLIYEGPACGDPYIGEIAVFLTDSKRNSKTGHALTVWVLPRDGVVDPVIGCKATCGDCELMAGRCYTYPGASAVLCKAATSIMRSYKAHHCSSRLSRTRAGVMRMCAFGDTAAVPLHVANRLEDIRRDRGLWPLGYTHAWRTRLDLVFDHMASVSSVEDRDRAKALGWRTFRVRQEGEPLLSGEIQCPGVLTDGPTCAECRSCCGLYCGPAYDISIVDHGPGKRRRRT